MLETLIVATAQTTSSIVFHLQLTHILSSRHCSVSVRECCTSLSASAAIIRHIVDIMCRAVVFNVGEIAPYGAISCVVGTIL